MEKYRRHFLVCITNRPPFAQESCGPKGSVDVLKKLQKGLDRKKLRELYGVAATGTTCLGMCEHGPNVVVYPDNVWYGGVQVDDVDELVDRHGIEGQPVERLLHPDIDGGAAE